MFALFSVADSFLNIPYKWGGNNPWEGYDCSGFVIAVLRSAGEQPPVDVTAQGLFDYFSSGKAHWDVWTAGSLIFFGNSATDIRHVGIMRDQYRMYESAGGDHTTTTLLEAIRRDARVKISLIADRKDIFKAVLRPYYRKIGQI